MTTVRPASPNAASSPIIESMASSASSFEPQTIAPLPAASPSAFTTGASASDSTWLRASVRLLKTAVRAVGMPGRCISSWANALEDSMRAAARLGPKAAIPSTASRSTRPRASGSSGPTTTSSQRFSRAALPQARLGDLDDGDDQDGGGGGQPGRPLLPGLEPLRLSRVVIQRALKGLRLDGDGALELAGVDATALLELAQELVLKVRHLREEADQRGVHRGRGAVPPEPRAPVRAEAGAAQGLGVTVGTGDGIDHGYLQVGRGRRALCYGRDPALLAGQFEHQLQAVLIVNLLADPAEAHLRRHRQGWRVVRRDGEPEQLHSVLPRRPGHHRPGGLQRVAAAPVRRQHRVPHLRHPPPLPRAVEAGVAGP